MEAAPSLPAKPAAKASVDQNEGKSNEISAKKTSAAPLANLLTSENTLTGMKYNSIIHTMYIRREYDQCIKLIHSALAESNNQCEYALYVKGIIKLLFASLEGKF